MRVSLASRATHPVFGRQCSPILLETTPIPRTGSVARLNSGATACPSSASRDPEDTGCKTTRGTRLVQRLPKDHNQHNHDRQRQDHQPAQCQAAGGGAVLLGLVRRVLCVGQFVRFARSFGAGGGV